MLFKFIVINLLMSSLLGHKAKEMGHNPPSADWWVLMTAKAVGTNSLTCLPKHGGARDSKILVTYPMIDL
jgi:hypothetical protein